MTDLIELSQDVSAGKARAGEQEWREQCRTHQAPRPLPTPKVQRPWIAWAMWALIAIAGALIVVAVMVPATRWMAHQVIVHEVQP